MLSVKDGPTYGLSKEIIEIVALFKNIHNTLLVCRVYRGWSTWTTLQWSSPAPSLTPSSGIPTYRMSKKSYIQYYNTYFLRSTFYSSKIIPLVLYSDYWVL